MINDSMQGRGVLVFFSLTLLLPGAALAVFGARALLQERQLVDQQLRERLEAAADTVTRDVEREFQGWQRVLEQGAPASGAGPEAGVLVSIAPAGLTVSPRESVLYDLAPSDFESGAGEPVAAPALLEAERLEIDRRDYPAAIARYQQLLASAPTEEQPELLHRLARTNRKVGRAGAALSLFEQLRTMPGLVGRVPAGLIGHYEVCAHRASTGDRDALGSCATDLYRRLIGGEWRLSKELYSYYSATAREWAAASAGSAPLIGLETAKGAFTAAVEGLLPGVCAGAPPASPVQVTVTREMLVISRCVGQGTATGRMLALNHAWLATHVWPGLTTTAPGASYHVALIDRDNRAFFSSDASGVPEPRATAVTRDIAGASTGWRVRVWPRDPDAMAAGLVMRQRMYGLTLVLVIGSLMFGAYATHRVVKRELQFAQLKSDFVSTVSHEFRSPLTAIRQLGELLMRDRVPESRRPEYYERITRESERLGRLVENLLDFAQMEEGRKRYHLQPLDTADWLRRTVAEFQSLRDGNSATVQATIPVSLPALHADPAALGCAIHNLLDNAIKYSPGADTVWLDAEGDGACVTIRVRDRGVGISESDRSQIFEKFFRANSEMAREVKGAGLGLSLVHHIVSAHHGRIECQSQPGQGTTFSIHLTAADVVPA